MTGSSFLLDYFYYFCYFLIFLHSYVVYFHTFYLFILCPLSNEIFQWRDLVVADRALGEGDGEGELVEGEGLVLEAKVYRFYIDRCYGMIGGGRGRGRREEGGGRGERGEGRRERGGRGRVRG